MWCGLAREYMLTGGVPGVLPLAGVLGARGGVLQKLLALATGGAFLGGPRGVVAGAAGLLGPCDTFAGAEAPTSPCGGGTGLTTPLNLAQVLVIDPRSLMALCQLPSASTLGLAPVCFPGLPMRMKRSPKLDIMRRKLSKGNSLLPT